jgi:spore coat protein U-like protein
MVTRPAGSCRRAASAVASLSFAWALLAAPLAAHAGADCSITSVGLNFGTYDSARGQPDDVAATITVTCVYVAPGTTGVSYTLSLSNGQYGSGPTDRRMGEGTAARLGYNVYGDFARTRIWGSGAGGTFVASGSMTVGPGVGNGTRTATHTVYGRIPQLQDATPGDYLDLLVLTLSY